MPKLKKAKIHTASKNKNIQEEIIAYKKGQPLVDKNSFGKERPWQKNKIENVRYSEYLKILKLKKHLNVHNCAETLNYKVTENGELKLHQVWFCKSRLCPLCNWRKAMKSSKQLEIILNEAVKKEPKGRFLFLTLTTKNTKNKHELKAELSKMGVAVHRLFDYKKIAKNLIGYVRSTEITVNSDDESYNQHMHILVMVKSTFFKGKDNYITQKQWTAFWKRAMKLDYTPVVNVKAVHDKKGKGSLKSAALETAKYQVKSADYLTDDDEKNLKVISDLEYALKNTRQISFAGLFKKLRKKLCLDDVEKGDLVHLDDEKKEENTIVKIAVAKFNFVRKNYYWLDDFYYRRE